MKYFTLFHIFVTTFSLFQLSLYMFNYKKDMRLHYYQGHTVLSLFDHLSELKVFNALLYDRNEDFIWIHTEDSRKKVCATITTTENVGEGRKRVRTMSELSFKKHLTTLTNKDIIKRISRGVYQFNKNYIS